LQIRTSRSGPLYAGLVIAAILIFLAGVFVRSPFVPAVSAANLFDGGSDQARITAAVKHDKPSVVALEVYVDGTRYVPSDPFGGVEPQTVQGRASGSGFVYDAGGTIVTNAHVVAPPSGSQVEKIDVLFANGDRVPGRVISMNRSADLALVKVDRYAKLPPPLSLGDSKTLQAGQWAIAIGEPLELRQTVTVGVVSGFDRSEPIGDEQGGQRVFKGLLQTSAPINPGHSGGPLIDMDGHVIGINQSVAGGAQGIGFAIPIDTIRTDVASMLLDGTTAKAADTTGGTAFVGIQLSPLSDDRSGIAYQGQNGVAVAAVTSGGPADVAGIEPGDVIEQIDGKAVDSPEAAASAIRAHQPGQSVAMQIWSGGSERSLAIQTTAAPQVGMAPPQAQSAAPGASPSDGGEQSQVGQNDGSDRGGDESP
jgi:S1-C subfamily serine protease